MSDIFLTFPQAFPPESNIHCLKRQGTWQNYPHDLFECSRNMQTSLHLWKSMYKLINMRTHLPITHTHITECSSYCVKHLCQTDFIQNIFSQSPNSRENKNGSRRKCAKFSAWVLLGCKQ